MIAAHTPGPWLIVGATVYALNADGFNRFSCQVQDAHTDVTELRANARLIAAAPDLLTSLIALDEAFCTINEFSSREERHASRLALIAARAAVAKATGAAA